MTANPRLRRTLAERAVAALLCGSLLSGCATMTPGADGNYARPIGSAPVTPNPTPYSTGLSCLAAYAAQNGIAPPRIAVGRLSDLTGRLDENGGRAVTQGASLMAMSALGKAGVPLVERYETDVSKLEYQLTNSRLISDDAPVPGQRRDYRPIYAGDMSGSQYFLTGGITELNTNIRTNAAGLEGSKGGGATKVGMLEAKVYVMNVGIDIRLVDTRSLDVVNIVSYQKQIIGNRIGGDLFSFFGGNVVSLSAETGGDEPVHLAVRSLIERAVIEIVADLYGAPGACLTPGLDPLAPTVVSEHPANLPVLQPAAYAPQVEPYPAQAPVYAPPAYGYAPAYAPAYTPPAPVQPAQPYAGYGSGQLPPPAYMSRY